MPDDEDAYFEEACSYFNEAGASTIFALGHWNDGGQTVSPQMSTPDLRTKLSTIEGCDLGEILTYMDGHVHCNELMQGEGEKEEIGFMIGGHSMSGCTQFGFAYVKSGGIDSPIEVYYFEENGPDGKDQYDAIKTCVGEKGVEGCLDLAEKWL